MRRILTICWSMIYFFMSFYGLRIVIQNQEANIIQFALSMIIYFGILYFIVFSVRSENKTYKKIVKVTIVIQMLLTVSLILSLTTATGTLFMILGNFIFLVLGIPFLMWNTGLTYLFNYIDSLYVYLGMIVIEYVLYRVSLKIKESNLGV